MPEFCGRDDFSWGELSCYVKGYQNCRLWVVPALGDSFNAAEKRPGGLRTLDVPIAAE
jgi:hypothetical protein